MADIQTDILAALRMQEAALLGVLETVRQAIQTVLSTQINEALDRMKTESTDVERRLMNQVLAELGVQFTSVDIFERTKKLKPGMKRDFLKRAIIGLELSGAIRKIEPGRGRHPARYQKRFLIKL
jgi:TRAP-type C4-dicarboxylate transport system substrate-binding protein